MRFIDIKLSATDLRQQIKNHLLDGYFVDSEFKVRFNCIELTLLGSPEKGWFNVK